jgi:hypothetical protein
MKKVIDELTIKLTVKLSLWSAIKLRIAGMKNSPTITIEDQMERFSIRGE